MKIIYSWGNSHEEKPFIEEDIREWIDAGYEVTAINHREELGIEKAWSPEKLNRAYIEKDARLFNLYGKIRKLSESHDIFIVNYENVYHPDFVESLKNIYTVIVSGDDPESSDSCSKPYVQAFDHSFAWGINFDKNTKITKKFLEWGAKRADFWPHGVREDMYDSKLTAESILNKDRDIDLVYVGSSGLKLGRIAAIKRAFPQIKIYGYDWNWKTFFKEFILYKKTYGNWNFKNIGNAINAILCGLNNVEEISADELIPLYQRAKIGINIHLSYGPSNLRMYQLPANGVMQICDCKEGLGDVYNIGKEIVVYDSIEEAIKLIRYYLEHEQERKKIAVAGFERTMRDYKRLQTFLNVMEKIKEGMKQKGIKSFKDGALIRRYENIFYNYN